MLQQTAKKTLDMENTRRLSDVRLASQKDKRPTTQIQDSGRTELLSDSPFVRQPQSDFGPKKKPRKSPARKLPSGSAAIQEIQHYQRTTFMLIPRAKFMRLAREIAQSYSANIRWEAKALMCLQEAAETHLTGYFEDATLATLHAKRVTLMVQDMRLVRRIRHDI
ncbi:core histone h2A/H2B/H3/H4 domain-containing protein [Ditylenchus destructor]|nr:core histone h2A/H2B/H3/H4 domain-containing protein [Ditylenchus destructor]